MENSQERQDMSHLSEALERDLYSTQDLDRIRLQQLGKSQVLKRNFGFMSMLGFSCTIMMTWEDMCAVFLQGFHNGGPAGLIYGFFTVWIGTMCLCATLGELASMVPTAGGQHYWVALLAPRSSRKFCSYITGWLSVTGWQAIVASGGYFVGTQIQGLVVLNHPSYDAQGWQGTLLYWAAIFIAVIFNIAISSALPKVETLILVIHTVGFLAIMIPIVYLAPRSTAEQVFTRFLNDGNWPTQGLSFFIGITGVAFAFLGIDAAIHMSEEIQNAAQVVPRCMLASVILNGCLGLGVLFALLFSLGDLEVILQTPPLTYPYMPIFLQAMRSLEGATIMISLVIVLGICAMIAFVATSSRMYWSFARDGGLPFSRYLGKVEKTSSIPLTAIVCTTSIACLLALLNIGSTVVFNDVISLAISSLYASYLICIILLLWRRSTRFIETSRHEITDLSLGIDHMRLIWGPFHLPGIWGIFVNAIACIYVLIILIFSFFPPTRSVTPSTMNYSCLVFGLVMIFSIVYYVVYAKKHYNGPFVKGAISVHAEDPDMVTKMTIDNAHGMT